MRQLVELNSQASKFDELGAEVIAVFREEKEMLDGLKKIKDKTKVNFTLAVDTPASQTKSYSPGKMEFDNYVIDSTGKIRAVIDGKLRTRAKAAQLISVLTEIKSESKSAPMDDRAAVERAMLDYVEGIYEVKPELIERGLHADLNKFGFWRPDDETDFAKGTAMTFDQLVTLATKYNKEGKIPSDAPKKVEVFEVMNKIASAKLTAHWGVDYCQLVKEDGQWKIRQVLWQSLPKN